MKIIMVGENNEEKIYEINKKVDTLVVNNSNEKSSLVFKEYRKLYEMLAVVSVKDEDEK